MSEYILILVTTQKTEEAETIGNLLVQQRKAACVSIIPKISSVFLWKGNIERQNEVQLFIKAKGKFLDDIISIIKSNHSYEVPEIIALPIIGGYKGYLNWIDESVK